MHHQGMCQSSPEKTCVIDNWEWKIRCVVLFLVMFFNIHFMRIGPSRLLSTAFEIGYQFSS